MISGQRIKARRKELGMTLDEVCQQVSGIGVSRLSNWEQGLNMIGVDEAKKLETVLRVSAAYILTVENTEALPTPPQDPIMLEMQCVFGNLSDAGKKFIRDALDAAKSGFMQDCENKKTLT